MFWLFVQALGGLALGAPAQVLATTPAQLVERGLLTVRGRTALDFHGSRVHVSRPHGDPGHVDVVRMGLGYGVLPRVSVTLTSGVGVSDGVTGLLDPTFGARMRLFRSEPSNTDLALFAQHQAASPLAGTTSVGLSGTEAAVVARRRAGPLLGTLKGGVTLWQPGRTGNAHGMTVGPTPTATGEALLQVGPLAWTGELSATALGEVHVAGSAVQARTALVDGGTGVVAQVTRGFLLAVQTSRPMLGPTPYALGVQRGLPRGPTTTLSIGTVW